MPQRNVVSWTALLTGYMRTGQMGKALFMFEEMPERDVPAWNAVISGCTQTGLFLEALSFFSRMVVDRTLPNKTTASCLFSACAHLGMLRLGKSLHGYVFKNSMGDSPVVCNALIDMHGKCSNVKKARWIFSTMSEKNITSWNSMINCLALQGHSSLAIETFIEMEQEGPQPDQVTFMGLLNDYLLSWASRFDVAMVIVRDIRIEPDEVVWGSLLNGARVHGPLPCRLVVDVGGLEPSDGVVEGVGGEEGGGSAVVELLLVDVLDNDGGLVDRFFAVEQQGTILYTGLDFTRISLFGSANCTSMNSYSTLLRRSAMRTLMTKGFSGSLKTLTSSAATPAMGLQIDPGVGE
ncbi:hypothetical protein ZIOFF_061058 [Zingiber officinale]|uniref:Pentatricopeptide repeat-containing protein n=1 Tax=Zingiber officinale TaxID=94328 RepID=A0A8J5KPG4_ZINOF|nr:hypothetical protein ZIOFF_061058 [Zingiber officinale]